MTKLTNFGKAPLYDPSDCHGLTHCSDISYGAEPLFGEAVSGEHASDLDLAVALQASNNPAMTQGTPVSQTISPQDLMIDDWAPDSTPSSFLETPGTTEFDSPNTFIANSTDPSPFMDHTLDFSIGSEPMNHFASLDDIEQMQAAALPNAQGFQSSADTAAVPMSRDASSGSKRPAKADARVSKRSRGPLPPIKVEDENDTVAVKRCRNTLAARKSRAKRQAHVEELEAEVERLTRDLEYWRNAAEQCADPAKLATFQRFYSRQSQ